MPIDNVKECFLHSSRLSVWDFSSPPPIFRSLLGFSVSLRSGVIADQFLDFIFIFYKAGKYIDLLSFVLFSNNKIELQYSVCSINQLQCFHFLTTVNAEKHLKPL